MSPAEAEHDHLAAVFAALGDSTRLLLVSRLLDGQRRSIAQLSEGLELTRQGVTKHLSVLKRAGIVDRQRVGRESLFTIEPEPMIQANEYLTKASAQWDEAIERLKAFVEE